MSAASRNCPWKIGGKAALNGTGEIFHFLSAKFPFLTPEFPFLKHQILGGLVRARLQFFSAKFAFSDLQFRFSSKKSAFLERRILGSVFTAVF